MKRKNLFAILLVISGFFVVFALLALSTRTDKLGKYVFVSAEFQRTDDTIAYNVGDLVGVALRFPNVVKNAGTSGDVLGFQIIADTSERASFNLTVLDDTTGLSLPADNDSLVWSYENLANVIAWIEGPLTVKQVDSSAASYFDYFYTVPFICKPTSKDLYAVLTCQTTFTPKALEKVRVGLWIRRN